MIGPFCPEQGTSSHETVKDLASTDEKIMFSGKEVGSEKKISEWSYKIHTTLEEMFIHKTDLYTFTYFVQSITQVLKCGCCPTSVLPVFPPG